MSMRECNHGGKYLGTPFCKFRTKTTEFQYVAERLASKLAGWKLQHLSLAGRNTLIKSVALAIPSFVMQVFRLPISICDKLDKLLRRFLWGARVDEKIVLSLRAWDSVYSQAGGGTWYTPNQRHELCLHHQTRVENLY